MTTARRRGTRSCSRPSRAGSRATRCGTTSILTVTTLGARLRTGRAPALLEAIHDRRTAVALWELESGTARELPRRLRGLPDLEAPAARRRAAEGTLRDLGAMRDACRSCVCARRVVAGTRGRGRDARRAHAAKARAARRLTAALVDEPPAVSKEGGLIRGGLRSRARRSNDLAHQGRWIAELEATERERPHPEPEVGTTACSATTSRSRTRTARRCWRTTSAADAHERRALRDAGPEGARERSAGRGEL